MRDKISHPLFVLLLGKDRYLVLYLPSLYAIPGYCLYIPPPPTIVKLVSTSLTIVGGDRMYKQYPFS